jgi:hypothetical protein
MALTGTEMEQTCLSLRQLHIFESENKLTRPSTRYENLTETYANKTVTS